MKNIIKPKWVNRGKSKHDYSVKPNHVTQREQFQEMNKSGTTLLISKINISVKISLLKLQKHQMIEDALTCKIEIVPGLMSTS